MKRSDAVVGDAHDRNGETKKIIVLYVDVRGSSVWTRRMSEDRNARHAFWMRYDAEMLRFKERTAAPFYKRLGDGRMYVWPIEDESKEKTVAPLVVQESIVLYSRVTKLINHQRSPRPPGIRIREMAGGASHEIYPDGEEDYLGYCTNTCHKLLLVQPEMGIVVHGNVKEMYSERKAKSLGQQFQHLSMPRRTPDGVDQEDMQELFAVVKWRLKP